MSSKPSRIARCSGVIPLCVCESAKSENLLHPQELGLPIRSMPRLVGREREMIQGLFLMPFLESASAHGISPIKSYVCESLIISQLQID